MKRLALTAFVLLAGLGTRVDAGSLPKPASSLARQKPASLTHSVRSPEQKLPPANRLESRDRHRDQRPTHAVRGK